MHRSRVPARWAPAALAALLALSACAPGGAGPTDAVDADPPPRSGADAGPALRVVATVAPIADLVARVGGGRVEVDRLVPSGADAHTYEPRPSDVAALAEADGFVGIGLGLNPGAVSLADQQLPAASVVLLGERYLTADALLHDHVHDESEGHTHDGSEGHTHDGASGSAPGERPNPHVWTSLPLALDLVDGIADTLERLDPDGADGYRERAAEVRAQIGALHERIGEAVATIPEEQRILVVYHDAFGYLARDYGLRLATAVQPSADAEPSAGEVRDLIDLVLEHDVPALFGSREFPSDVLEVVAEETGAVYVGELADDELPGAPGDPGHSYLGLMRRNAELIVDHLGGDAGGLGD